jgi:hypothetical protein
MVLPVGLAVPVLALGLPSSQLATLLAVTLAWVLRWVRMEVCMLTPVS